MLDDLMAVICDVQQKISVHRTTLRQNEIRTRTVLIDPILNALGWNVTDPSRVSIEYSTDHGQVDYALIADTKPVAIVEAKKLDEPLKKHEMQMLTYAMSQGIKYALLTDGDIWEMFDVFKVSEMTNKKTLNVKLSSTPASSSALSLLALWNTSLQFGESIPPSEPIVSPQLPHPEPGRVSLTEYDPKPGTPCPGQVRFWDGSVAELKTWRDLFGESVRKVFVDGRLTPDMLPIGTRRNSHISLVASNPDGSPMTHGYELSGTPIFIDLNISAEDARRRARRVLSLCGLDVSSVTVSPGNQ